MSPFEQKNQFSLENNNDDESDREGQPIKEVTAEQPTTEFTREQQVTEDKRSVKTTVISKAGDDLQSQAISEDLVSNHVVPLRSEDVSAFSCYECNRTKVKLMSIITEDRKSAYCCMRCITFEVLDIHFEEFLDNSEKYNGIFQKYLDKQNS